MKNIVKIISILLFTCLLLASTTISAAAEYPDTVRIGLNYGGDDVPSVSVCAEKGIEIGYLNSGTFKLLVDQKDNTPLIIQKDGHFVKTPQGEWVEYSPTEGIPYEGQVYGPWHLKIGDTVPDFVSAQSLVTILEKSGVDAYVTYESGWQVWTGFYADSKAAGQALLQVKTQLGMDTVSVTSESFSRFVIFDSNFEVQMLYGGTDGVLQVWPKQENNPYVFSADGKRYRGCLEVRRYTDSDLTLINELNLEQYLYGVIPAEIEADAPPEAVKAQAVAARTFTYRNMKQYAKWGFDLVDTDSSQVYKGYDGERASASRAVDETKGKKMLYKGSLAQIFYFASSGGMTANVNEVWGSEIPYLLSVADPYELEISSHYIWEKSLTDADIKMILFKTGEEIGDIVSVSAEEYSSSGRVTKLRITGTAGQTVYYNADTRTIFSLNSQKYTIQSAGNVVVKAADGSMKTFTLDGRAVLSSSGVSTLAPKKSTISVIGSGNNIHAVSMSSGTYVFSGRGWGHGVGMSQEGAKGFAREGYTYDQILMHYYTGIAVE